MKIAAVIGHGKSPVGKGWGKHIDGCDLVLRMWDWDWQKPEDWGIRYDFGLIEAFKWGVDTFWEHNKRIPNVCWVCSQRPEWQRERSRLQLPDPNNVVNSDRYERLGQRLGGAGVTGRLKLQRGTVGACWMIEQPEIDEVILVGFDNAYARKVLSIKEGYPAEYVGLPSTFPFKDYEKYVNKTKYGNHDYAVERPLLVRVAREARVKLSFSQDVWASNGLESDVGGSERTISQGS